MIELTKEYISGLIEQRGMTKVEFAAKMGYKERQYLDSVLNNKKKDITTVVKMAEVLGMPLLEFIGETQPERTIYGQVFVDRKPYQINSMEDLEALLKELNK